MLTADGGIVEIQATAEKTSFKPEQFDALMALARKGTAELHAAQLAALAG